MPLTRAQTAQQSASRLLALPEPLLLAVLQCLAAPADQRSLFSAARAHSRLQQAGVQLVSSIAVMGMTGAEQQRTVDGVLLYLSRHGQHVRSIGLMDIRLDPGLFDKSLALHQLPATLQLHSLELTGLKVQLLPGAGCQGVLGYDGVSALQQLRLKGCELLEGEEGLGAALAQLTRLQHLSLDCCCDSMGNSIAHLPRIVLQQGLQQLTHLELDGDLWGGPGLASLPLQPLQAFSRLVDLRLSAAGARGTGVLTPSMLSGSPGLTRLELLVCEFEPVMLAGMTQLQHLECDVNQVPEDGGAWMAELLSQLGSLQQLKHLAFHHLHCLGLMYVPQGATPPPAAYSALTASSRLQRLELWSIPLPAGVWQHVFPAGRQLPHLTALVAFDLRQPSGDAIEVPEFSLLVSCCPGLRSLDVQHLTFMPGALTPHQGLSALHTLAVGPDRISEAWREVSRLARLQELEVDASQGPEELLLQTTQLRQLTRLDYKGRHDGAVLQWTFVAQAPGDEPVWRQVLRHHLDHSDPAVAQAAAALEAE